LASCFWASLTTYRDHRRDRLKERQLSEYVVRPLEPDTWAGFAGMAERHNGVFGGCWCTWFHTMPAEKERTYEANRSLKRRLVDEGRAHAALVYDGDETAAWCQYGSPTELPNIYHRKQYEAELDVLPDYRITRIFVDKRYRRQGLSAVALQGALDLISAAGGASSRVTRTTPAARRSRSSTTEPGQCSSRRASSSFAPRA
jgi:GNAT superfamily N-acetyltransferase